MLCRHEIYREVFVVVEVVVDAGAEQAEEQPLLLDHDRHRGRDLRRGVGADSKIDFVDVEQLGVDARHRGGGGGIIVVDQLDRAAGDRAHRECGAAARVAIDAGEHDAGDADLLVERLGRRDGVLADHCVGDEQRFVGLHEIAHAGHGVAVLLHGGERGHVEPGAKGAALARQHDDASILARLQLRDCLRQTGEHRRIKRVHLVGAGQADVGHAVGDGDRVLELRRAEASSPRLQGVRPLRRPRGRRVQGLIAG